MWYEYECLYLNVYSNSKYWNLQYINTYLPVISNYQLDMILDFNWIFFLNNIYFCIWVDLRQLFMLKISTILQALFHQDLEFAYRLDAFYKKGQNYKIMSDIDLYKHRLVNLNVIICLLLNKLQSWQLYRHVKVRPF